MTIIIVAAALRLNDGILTFSLPKPMRHHDIIRSMNRAGISQEIICSAEQGFLGSDGGFWSRERACSLARHSEQIAPNGKKPCEPQDELFSEDLW